MTRKPVAVLHDVDECTPGAVTGTLDETTAQQLAEAFAALADPVRLRLFNLIASSGRVCSCDLLAPLNKSQPTVSHHTRILSEAGLIHGHKEGRWVWWSVDRQRVRAIRQGLLTAVGSSR